MVADAAGTRNAAAAEMTAYICIYPMPGYDMKPVPMAMHYMEVPLQCHLNLNMVLPNIECAGIGRTEELVAQSKRQADMTDMTAASSSSSHRDYLVCH